MILATVGEGRARQARLSLAVLAATLVAALGLVLASTAFGGGRTCGTSGGISYCAQIGKLGFADRLTIWDMGKSVISSFSLAFPAGTTVTGVAGNAGCHASGASVACSTPVKPNGSQIVDAIANAAVGSKVILTMSRGASGASVALVVAAAAEGASTVVATTTSQCEATLKASKELDGWVYLETAQHGYLTVPREPTPWKVRVDNTSHCVAKNVEIDDTLPPQFDCTSASAFDGTHPVHGVTCAGRGRHLSERIGDLAPGAFAELEVWGKFAGVGKASSYETTNVAFAKADNAGEDSSNTVHVEVVRHSKLVKP